VKAVGVPYGIEHRIRGEGFEALLFLDRQNRLVRALDYRADEPDAMLLAVRAVAEANELEKIIVMATSDDWLSSLRHGYGLEAVVRHYHRGEDAYVVSKFRTQSRQESPMLMSEIRPIDEVMATPPRGPSPLRQRSCPRSSPRSGADRLSA
jgi:hypothetical protein